MKIKIAVLVMVLFVADSCRRVCGCFLPPPPKPFNFEIIGKDGKSLVTSPKDSVTITYLDNNYSNKNITIRLTIKKLYTDFSDTTAISPYYNGLYVTDMGRMSILDTQSPPANTFNLSVNGVNAGVIVISYQQYQESYPQFSKTGLSFNDMPVSFAHGVDLLQLQ